jgi:hypothetical protein
MTEKLPSATYSFLKVKTDNSKAAKRSSLNTAFGENLKSYIYCIFSKIDEKVNHAIGFTALFVETDGVLNIIPTCKSE